MAVPKLPELILEAVTKSASIKGLHHNGGVLWDRAALEKLSTALMKRFRKTAKDKKVVELFLLRMRTSLEEGEEMEEIAERLIALSLFIGTGLYSIDNDK